MSSDRITTEQRKGIHDRGRSIGFYEGKRSLASELASLEGPDKVGSFSVYAAGLVIDAHDDEDIPPQAVRFNKVAWHDLGVETLGDLTLLTDQELADAQPDAYHGANFVAGVTRALKIFNIERSST